MTLEQSFDGHGMIVPRSWNNQNSWAHALLSLYVNGNKGNEKGLSGIVDGHSSLPNRPQKAAEGLDE